MGHATNSKVENCVSNVSINVDSNSAVIAGGLAGMLAGSSIENCTANGNESNVTALVYDKTVGILTVPKAAIGLMAPPSATYTKPAAGNLTAEITFRNTGAPPNEVTFVCGFTITDSTPPPAARSYIPPAPSSGFSGENHYTQGSGTDLVHITQKSFSYFSGVRMNGKTLSRDTDYRAESGSTKITVFAEFLDALPVGEHTLEVRFTDGVRVRAKFAVSEAPEPEPEPEPWVSPFADVTQGDWFRADVEYVYTNGLMSGTSAVTFGPNMRLTRGMAVTILYRGANSPGVSGFDDVFDDAPSGAWYRDAVLWSAANGIAGGYGGGRFDPEDDITRQDLAVILWRFAGLDVSTGETTNILSYADAFDVSEYAIPAMQWACGAGLITGKPGGLLDPRGTATRAETAAMLRRFLENSYSTPT